MAVGLAIKATEGLSTKLGLLAGGPSYSVSESSWSEKSKTSSNPLHRHDCDKHEGNPQSYVTTIVAREKKIVRYCCMEAIQIEKQPTQLSLNARQEGGRGGVVRIAATRV